MNHWIELLAFGIFITYDTLCNHPSKRSDIGATLWSRQTADDIAYEPKLISKHDFIITVYSQLLLQWRNSFWLSSCVCTRVSRCKSYGILILCLECEVSSWRPSLFKFNNRKMGAFWKMTFTMHENYNYSFLYRDSPKRRGKCFIIESLVIL